MWEAGTNNEFQRRKLVSQNDYIKEAKEMIDIHSHVIHGVDDGASSMEESLKMLEEAENAGVKVIIATPHFQQEVFKTERLHEHYQQLCTVAKERDITLLLGSEVFLDPFLPEIIIDNPNLVLNESMYLLLEFPFDSIPFYSHEVIYKLQIQGIVPIIAHPERNRCFVRDIDALIELIERGCLTQLDAASIVGIYGRKIKKFTKKLIKNKLVQFIACDAHCAKDYSNWYLKAYKRARQWGGEAYADKLFYTNAADILYKTKGNIHLTT